MNKNLITTLILVVFGQFSYAQFITVESTEFLKMNDNSTCFYPRFSPAGDYLLVSGSGYTGLRAYDFASKTITRITDDAGAGYNTQISADGKTILYSKTELVKNLRHNSLVQVEKATRIKKQLVAPTRETLTPGFAVNKSTYIAGKKFVRANVSSSETKPIITIEDRKMVLYTGSIRKLLTPNGQDASYIWPSISPDMKNIVYTVAGKGTYVCKIDGSNPIFIGKINAPIWLSNSWIIGMDDKDDGEKLISSTLIAATIDGKIRQTVLTPTAVMAMYPAASANGKRIAFNTEKGEIYILNVSIK